MVKVIEEEITRTIVEKEKKIQITLNREEVFWLRALLGNHSPKLLKGLRYSLTLNTNFDPVNNPLNYHDPIETISEITEVPSDFKIL